MTETKKSFLREEDLRDRWLAVVKQEWYQRVMVYARAEAMSMSAVNAEQIIGMNRFIEVLASIADKDEPASPMVPRRVKPQPDPSPHRKV